MDFSMTISKHQLILKFISIFTQNGHFLQIEGIRNCQISQKRISQPMEPCGWQVQATSLAGATRCWRRAPHRAGAAVKYYKQESPQQFIHSNYSMFRNHCISIVMSPFPHLFRKSHNFRGTLWRKNYKLKLSLMILESNLHLLSR